MRVALTFDVEHPSREHHNLNGSDSILAVLERAEIAATFFVQGRWATAYPDHARRIDQAGHLVGHHSHFHAPMTLLGDPGIRADIEEGAESIARIVGRDPRPWFRCPFGDGHNDPRVLDALSRAGCTNVHWDVDSNDWRGTSTASEMASEVVDGIRHHGDGAVVLFHSWPVATPEAISRIVGSLRDEGATFVTVDSLVAA